MSTSFDNKPIIGFTSGDINGIGIELIIKTLSDSRLLELCTPVIFANNKVINFYRKSLPDINFSFSTAKDSSRINNKQVNVYNCWEEDIAVTPGLLNDVGGKYAVMSLTTATEALKAAKIDGLVTAPVHKKNIQSADFNFTGHTPYLKHSFGVKEVAMFMIAENMRIALLTEHVAIKDVAQYVTRENILSKLQVVNESLKKDFGINKPKIAVLGLNPHAGDEGLLGTEENEIIRPVIAELKNKGKVIFGPFPADGFFASGQYTKYDGILAMYHDQGLVAFKTLAFDDGVNFTAGLSVVRTSPDHGTAYNIAGKNLADESSMRQAIYMACDIVKNQQEQLMEKKV